MTKTVKGKEIDMASLIASNDRVTAVGNIKMNARGALLGPGGTINVPSEQVQSDYYKKELSSTKEVQTAKELAEKVSNTRAVEDNIDFDEGASSRIVAERKFKRNKKEFIEIEYADGSIEEKEV